MIKNKFISDISISTAQAFLNQFSGIFVFFILSRYLDKNSFGQVSWALAMLMLVFSILGFGMEQIAVKKVAMGMDPVALLQSYLFHVLLTGSGFIILLLLIGKLVPALQMNGSLFILLSISQCLSFFATPFRQVANGLEKFNTFFIMSCTASIIKVLVLLSLALLQKISLEIFMYVYLLASFSELLVCILLFRSMFSFPIMPRYDPKKYAGFIKEALPQFGITICNTAIQRMDWILLGILSTSAILAEYSFTNKLFELFLLPLLMIAPVFFPLIVKAVTNTDAGKLRHLRTFVKMEVVIAVFFALIVNICWKDVINILTGEKYGDSTTGIIFVMSFSMPLAYINNFLWGINFAKGNMRIIFLCILISFFINIAADCLLIPFFSAMGAAIGFTLANMAQTFYYSQKTRILNNRSFFSQVLLIYMNGLAAGLLARYLFHSMLPQLLFSVTAYLLLIFFTRQLNSKELLLIKKIAAV